MDTTDIKKLNKLKKRAKKIKIRLLLLSYAMDLLIPAIAAFFLFSFLLLASLLSGIPLNILSAALIAFSICILTWMALKVIKTARRKPLSPKKINLRLQKEYPQIQDRLFNALSLLGKKDEYSSPLSRAAIEGLADETLKMTGAMPAGVISLKKFYRALAAFLCGLFLFLTIYSAHSSVYGTTFTKLFFYAALRSEYTLNVETGDISVLPGGEAEIISLTNAPDTPVIEYIMLDRKYEKNMQKLSKNKYSGSISDIEAPVSYRVSADRGRLKSPYYNISLKRPPRIEEIQINYNYPAYTKKSTSVSTSPHISALKGTIVTITAKSDSPVEKAEIITDKDEKEMERKSERELQANLKLQNQSYYKIKLYAKDGSANNPVKYSVRPVEDTPPEIELIMPTEDMHVPPEAKVEIRGRAKDAFGLSRIYIQYYTGVGGEYRERHIKNPTSKKESFSYIWDISRTGAKAGSVITYSIIAEDINTLYGPGKSSSPEMRLEIEDFRNRHEETLEKADDITEKFYQMLEKSYDTSMNIEDEDFELARKQMQAFEEAATETEETLRSFMEELEEDPYMDAAVSEEFKGIEKRFQNLKERDLSSLSRMLEKQAPESKAKSEEISRELEKLASLSEQASKKQRMSDVLSSADEALNSSRDLQDLISQQADLQEIMAELSRLQDILNELMNSALDYPENLPDEFINEESMQQLDLEQMQSRFSELYDAINEGDHEKAKELLSQLTSALENMMETMYSAAESSYEEEMDELSMAMLSMSEKLSQVARRQEELIERTDNSLEDLLKIRESYQKERMEELHREFKVLSSTLNLSMHEIEGEFRQGYLYKSPEILKEHLQNLKEDWKKEKIKNFIQKIEHSTPKKELLTEEIKESIYSQQTDQKEINDLTSDLQTGFESLSHATAMMDMQIIENLLKASQHMQKAEKNLQEHELP
ncbi:MAG: DUF4175 family protein, partial [Elusimicrobiota bacterium]